MITPPSLLRVFVVVLILSPHPNLVYLARAHYITKTRFDSTAARE